MPNLHANPDILLALPRELLSDPPQRPVPPGYSIRDYRPGDEEAWIRMHRRAVPSFDETRLRRWWDRYLSLALPRGILFAVTDGPGAAVATAGCIHQTRNGTIPFGGQLAWVATDPDHQGRGLATALAAAATRRLIEMGYESIVVCTGDDLLPAIKVYLRLGYRPLLYEDDMPQRWRQIMEQIDLPFEVPAHAGPAPGRENR